MDVSHEIPTPRLAQAISVARVLCIYFVMFVHVYTGSDGGVPIMGSFGALDVYYRFCINVLGRSSVPLMTIISGWLFYKGAHKAYPALVRSKLTTLIVPMVLWSAITLALLVAHAQLTGDHEKLPKSALDWANALFSLSTPPAGSQLAFLRDLFVIFLFSPILMLLMARLGVLLVVATALFCVLMPHTLVLLRTQILFFFVLGLYLARRDSWRVPGWLVPIAAVIATAIFVVSIVLIIQGRPSMEFPGRELLTRLSVATLFWYAAMWVSSRPDGWLLRLAPYAFLAFCSHLVLFRAFSVVGVKIFGGPGSALYPVYFTIQPFMGFAFAVAFGWVLVRIAPALLRPLNAGKLVPLTRRPALGARDETVPSSTL